MLPELPCACASLRRASRIVTQLYSSEMGGEIEPGQFSLLTALKEHPEASQTPLVRALGLDKTTMSRNLRVMQKNGWIEPGKHRAAAGDRREKSYHLTPAGEAILAATHPAWVRAQKKLAAVLSPAEWDMMLKLSHLVAEAAVTLRK
jgi:DNA-binding MarR family transcriptional regulator